MGQGPCSSTWQSSTTHAPILPLAVRTDFLTCILLYSLVNCVQGCYFMPQGSERRSERLHLKSHSRVEVNAHLFPASEQSLEISWAGSTRKAGNGKLQTHHCFPRSWRTAANRCLTLSNNPEREPFFKTRARTLPKEILCLKNEKHGRLF